MIMEAKRMRQDIRVEEDEELILEDRLSDLPNCIIIHILSLLPTVDAIQTSLLSKRWRRMWPLVSAVDIYDARDVNRFRRRDKESTGRKSLMKFVDECLKYPFADTTISKFKLKMTFSGGSGRVDGWLLYPILKNVKELDLCIHTRINYTLPHFILGLRELTVVRLSCIVLKTLVPVCLPSLKELILSGVRLEDGTVKNLLLGCPSLDKLCLYSCSGFLDPEFSSTSLKHMEFVMSGVGNFWAIKVEAVNLRYFFFDGDYNRKSRVNLVRCPAVRNLSLKRACLDDQWLENLIPQLTHLESLSLTDCNGPRRIKIQNQHLKDLVFESDRRLDSLEATIDTPSLVSFRYAGLSMFEISVNAPNLVDVDIRIRDYPRKSYDTEWYTSLINFLSEFNCCNKVDMFCSNKKALIIPDELRKICQPPCPDLKCLKVKAPGSPMFRKNMFRKSLIWIAPSLETLSIE